jgi:trehalose 6-phosphate phosphatase
MVVELLPPDASKSDAVTLFMSSPPFQDRIPISVGDDTTDEHAFAAAQRFGGFGIQVGEARPTLAAHRLASVSAVRSWLLSSLGRAIT